MNKLVNEALKKLAANDPKFLADLTLMVDEVNRAAKTPDAIYRETVETKTGADGAVLTQEPPPDTAPQERKEEPIVPDVTPEVLNKIATAMLASKEFLTRLQEELKKLEPAEAPAPPPAVPVADAAVQQTAERVNEQDKKIEQIFRAVTQ